MKIFFIGDRKTEKNIKINSKIIRLLEKNNYKVDKSLLQHTHEEDFANFDVTYKRNSASIKNSDLIVAEVTGISSGIGFLLATALNQRKPVIALFDKDQNIRPSLTLKGVKNSSFMYKEYSEKDVEQILIKSLNQMKQKLDTKFILIIPAEIDRYLQWASDYKRMHKAQIVREAVEKYMDSDKDWQEFLNDDSEM